MTKKKTKILAKIADNRSEITYIKSLFDAGADIAWLNTAHQDEAATIAVVDKIRSITDEIPIMIDTKGPEVRTKNIAAPFEVKTGDYITFTGNDKCTGTNVVQVTYANFHNEIPVGEVILYDDASIETIVEEKVADGIRCVVKNPGLIKNKKSLNIPNVHIQLPALSDKDKSFIHFCAKYNIDYIIHSFVRTKDDIFEIKEITKQYPAYKGKIIAKIENREGFDHTKEILENCDGLMVARGDLGAEVPFEELPYMQKKMVEESLRQGKYCIVATQVLESMIKNPRPTRAEVTDIANAVLDGTGAISMSGETAYGDYPIEATTLMGRVMAYTEEKRDELVHYTTTPASTAPAFESARNIIKKAEEAKARAIFISVKDIAVVRALSALRPKAFVVAGCLTGEDQRELRLAYAVYGVKVTKLATSELVAFGKGLVAANDPVVTVEEGASGELTVSSKKFSDL